jgi:cold shock CspA family protein
LAGQSVSFELGKGERGAHAANVTALAETAEA